MLRSYLHPIDVYELNSIIPIRASPEIKHSVQSAVTHFVQIQTRSSKNKCDPLVMNRKRRKAQKERVYIILKISDFWHFSGFFWGFLD